MERQNMPDQRSKWTDAELIAGFNKFKSLYGRFPSAGEVDIFEYLPSSRSIQRTHGGLVLLRKRLFPDLDESYHDLTRGHVRSMKAKEADLRAKKYEYEFYSRLCEVFLPISIHEQKRIRPGDVSCDIYIYTDELSGVVIDLFYAQDLITLGKIVTIKNKRYKAIQENVLFILIGNQSISQESITSLMNNRKEVLKSNIKVLTENYFMNHYIENLSVISKFKR